jgi:hypothetical protein
MYLSVPAGDFIEMCMKAAGYDFDYDDRNCSAPYIAPNGSVVSERPNAYSYCYVPNTKWERAGRKLENWFRGEKPLG